MHQSSFLSSFLLLAIAHSAHNTGRDVSLNSLYGFVIIGGGTSGLTVADRLTENPKITVLVIEYGPLDHHENSVLVPGLLNLTSTPYSFNLTSVPQQELENHLFGVPAAAVVGEGTVINGMFFDRGSAADYDAWESLGNRGWAWKDLLPYFRKSENFTPATNSFAEAFDISWNGSVHGFAGPVQSSYPVFQFPSIKNFFQGWNSNGVPTANDPGSGDARGAFWAPSSLDPQGETRSYARKAHYDRVVRQRPNYHSVTETAVSKILFKGKNTTGVEYVSSIEWELWYSDGKQGDEGLFKTYGIKPLVNLPVAGRNFQDHPTLYPVFNSQIIPNVDELISNQTYAKEQLALYFAKRQGPYTIVNKGGNTVAFLPLPNITSSYESIIDLAKSEQDLVYGSGLYSTVLSGYHAQREIFLRLYGSTGALVQETGWSGGAVLPITLVKPLSRGFVTINSTKILQPPLIDWKTFTFPSDIEIMITAVRINRKLMESKPMQELKPIEVVPSANLTTDEEVRSVLKQQVVPTYSYPCCICSMMEREFGGVVDNKLTVHVYAVAEKAADLIKERWRIDS